MWRRLASAGRSQRVCTVQPRQLPGASREVSVKALPSSHSRGIFRERIPPGSRRGAATQFGAYLENAGATWGDAMDVQEVRSVPSSGHKVWSWRVDLPEESLAALQKGTPLESPPFSLGAGPRSSARFQFYPKGDADCESDDMCSLWLLSDEAVGPVALRVGTSQRSAGASEFCKLDEALKDGHVDIALQLQSDDAQAPEPLPAPAVQQSLHLTGLQLAEWRIFQMDQLRNSDEFVTSPPFRFHHVLLGDMYLELQFGAPHPGFCTVFFRCRVPSMKLKVNLAVGQNFSKTFAALGRSQPEDDIKSSSCLPVNLEAPDVIGPDGELVVRCSLEEVVSLPAALRDMIPRLDERALWPKRL